ncbi:hypothetical protein CkaCkLH20_13286 [Colletotrichum karsti]|uniref:NmrA-like domain-containing protein n=1 Tax=Colletotrichum karsti TaxID=1095194 RepID=A0A9P6HVX2_9PEZI|nr:uncharacterized protein CkaCkLH20_13286 [Colletotrichum karsti]KAF9869241.1 hypothetical protein CkaCkLH20_13286 [Colletotrichum karsti]
MIRVAVAGGATGLGKTIVDTIQATTQHECIILSRKSGGELGVVGIDYSNVGSIRNVLEKHKIQVVISTIGVYTEQHYTSQLNLIEAADLSATTTRFIPSEFGIALQSQHADRSPSFPFKLKTIERLEKGGLEYTLVHTGLFLDYLAWPVVPSDLEIQSLIVNLRRNRAVIPGSGNTHIAWAHTRDVASFTVALLDFKDWDKRYFSFADRLTPRELVQLCEKIKGVKFEVTYDKKEDLEEGRCTLLPHPTIDDFKHTRFDQIDAFTSYMAKLGSIIDDGLTDLGTESSFKRICPEIAPLTARQVISQWVASNGAV